MLNVLLSALPKTGESFTAIFVAGFLLLVAVVVAIIFLILRKKRQ